MHTGVWRMATRRGIVDFKTGEVVELRPGTKRLKLTDLYGYGWAGFSLTALSRHLRDREITGMGHRVLGGLLARLSEGNDIPIRISDLCRLTGMHRGDVTRQLTLLDAKKVIERSPDGGWRLRPRMGFKGNPTGIVDSTTLEFFDAED